MRLYPVARVYLTVMKWFVPAVLCALFLGFVANLLVVKVTDLPYTVSAELLNLLIKPGIWQTSIILVSAFLLVTALIALISVMREKVTINDHLLQSYLQIVIESNQSLNPSGFAQPSQALISVNVPLNDIFIRLNAVPDRPIYDRASEQEHQKLLDDLRLRTDLKMEEREELIQRLQVMWYSQIGQQGETKTQRRSVPINDIFEYINIESPVAVLLGTPGSGKSTTLRWLSLHMARTMLSQAYQLPHDDDDDDDDDYYYYDALRRIPVLLRISDYAKHLVKATDLSIEQFLRQQIAEAFPKLPALAVRLLEEIRKGRCLLLLDGLDEVASDSLRRQVAQNIDKFIAESSRFQTDALHWNMFIITSRIVGYESGSFARYAHFTLLDFEDEQIEQFLTKWCPTVERYQTMFAQGMKSLTSQQEAHVEKEGANQKSVLVDTIFHNSGIKRLAVNPLMLTILALIQRSGKTLPHRRIELYQIVTRTLLDNWNKTSERRVFPVEEVPLAEQMLGNLAYQLHSTDPILTEQEVKSIARRTMNEFYGYSSDQIKDSDITQFIEVLRGSSGLFIESGQGLFNFMHRTFQEYFVALHLLRKTPQELKQFVTSHYHSALWREPLLLAIAYKSGQSGRVEWQEASELIRAIKEVGDVYNQVLRDNLLFAASTIVDCSAWSIDKQLQQEVANSLFELYGDDFGSGHYKRLKHEIAKVTLLWLRGQPQDTNHARALSPLLVAWSEALQDVHHPIRCQGAVSLLAMLAPQLASSPRSVLNALIPHLFSLADVTDMPFAKNEHWQALQTQPSACLQVAYYAWLTLTRITPHGPLDQLNDAWVDWCKREPEAYERLKSHLDELDAGFVLIRVNSRFDARNWNAPIRRFMLARLVEAEVVEQSMQARGWRNCWYALLQKEMARGRFATYLPCLSLCLLLAENGETQRQHLREELLKALATHDQRSLQVLVAFMLSYLELLGNDQYQDYEAFYEDGEYYRSLPRPRGVRRPTSIPRRVLRRPQPYPPPRRHLSQPLPALMPSGNLVVRPLLPASKPTLMQRWRRTRQLARRKLNEWREDWPVWVPFSLQEKDTDERLDYEPANEPDDLDATFAEQQTLTQQQSIWRFMLNIPEIPYFLSIWERHEFTSELRDILPTVLKREELVEALCELLADSLHTTAGIELLTLHVVLATFDSIPSSLQARVEESLSRYREVVTTPTPEQAILLDALVKRLSGVIEQIESPDTREAALQKIRDQVQLSKEQVELLLQASIDTRRVSTRSGGGAVYDLAWEIVRQSFVLDVEAQRVAVASLKSDTVMLCASAASLLRYCKTLSSEMRLTAMEEILAILADPVSSRRSLDAPDGYDWRLDDILFESLQSLAGYEQ